MLRVPILVLASALLHAQAPPSSTGNLDLRVTTTAGDAVAGATVSVQGPDSRIYSGTTATDGHFRLMDLPLGTYKFQAFNAPGYIRDQRNFLADFSIHPGNTRSALFQLRAVGKLQGFVTDDLGNPIEGVTILAVQGPQPGVNESTVSAATDSRGFYSLSNTSDPPSFLAPRTILGFTSLTVKAFVSSERAARTGQAYHPGFPLSAQTGRIDVAPGQTVNLDFALRPSPSFHVRGRVTDLPAASAALNVRISTCGYPEEESLTSRLVLQENGSFDAAGILPGVYCVTVETLDQSSQANQWSATQVVSVSNIDVDGVELTRLQARN